MDNRLLISVAALSAACALSLTAHAGEGSKSGEAEVQKMDTNRDGGVSADEHSAGAKDKFAKMDTDKDGNVTVTEMDAAHAARKAQKAQTQGADSRALKPEKSSAEKIKVIDTNGDGILSAEEHAAGSRSMFEKMDVDRDGRLTAQEVEAGHKAMVKKTN